MRLDDGMDLEFHQVDCKPLIPFTRGVQLGST